MHKLSLWLVGRLQFIEKVEHRCRHPSGEGKCIVTLRLKVLVQPVLKKITALTAPPERR